MNDLIRKIEELRDRFDNCVNIRNSCKETVDNAMAEAAQKVEKQMAMQLAEISFQEMEIERLKDKITELTNEYYLTTGKKTPTDRVGLRESTSFDYNDEYGLTSHLVDRGLVELLSIKKGKLNPFIRGTLVDGNVTGPLTEFIIVTKDSSVYVTEKK